MGDTMKTSFHFQYNVFNIDMSHHELGNNKRMKENTEKWKKT